MENLFFIRTNVYTVQNQTDVVNNGNNRTGRKHMSTLRKERTRAGLAAIGLAEKAGTTETRIFCFERQRFKPRPDEAARIARALGVTVEKLWPGLAAKGGA